MSLHSNEPTQVQTAAEEASSLTDSDVLRFEHLLHRAKEVGQQIEGRVRRITQDDSHSFSQGSAH